MKHPSGAVSPIVGGRIAPDFIHVFVHMGWKNIRVVAAFWGAWYGQSLRANLKWIARIEFWHSRRVSQHVPANTAQDLDSTPDEGPPSAWLSPENQLDDPDLLPRVSAHLSAFRRMRRLGTWSFRNHDGCAGTGISRFQDA